jgi:hypothetical protein
MGEERLDAIIVSALATAPKNERMTVTKLVRRLGTLLDPPWSSVAEQREHVDARVRALVLAGELDGVTLRATDAGLARARHTLGVAKLPTSWQRLCDALLPSLAVGDSRALSPDELRARLLETQLELGLEGAKLGEVLDAWMWRAIGLPSREPFSVGKARARLLERTLGVPRVSATAADNHLKLLTAHVLEAPRGDNATMRRVLARRWLALGDDGGRVSPATEGSDDLARLATDVKSKAAAIHDAGRYNERKVFISAAWRALAEDARYAGLGLDAFKTQLALANRHGLVRLHRADLVSAMDPDEVERSEVRYLNATFHFIESEATS